MLICVCLHYIVVYLCMFFNKQSCYTNNLVMQIVGVFHQMLVLGRHVSSVWVNKSRLSIAQAA